MGNLPSKEEKETYVHEMFNGIAKKYDLMNSLMSFGLDKSWRKFTVQRSELQPGGQALDCCCGTAMLCMELAKVAGDQGSVTGLDFSENMLAVGRKNIKQSPFSQHINLIQGNAMDLPFDDNSFDCVTVGWGLRNVPDIMQTVSEMMRVVKPGGKVVSLDMARPTAPVFKQGYWLYFDKLVPLMGKIWAGKKSAYSYLNDSSKVFPPQWELTEMFARVGLQEAKYTNLLGGVVAVVEGRKPR